MHTKEELEQKKSKTKQLDLVEEVSASDNLTKKRKYLFFAIFATIGLSLIFWIFRTSQYFINHPADLIPHFSFSLPNKISSPLTPLNLEDRLETQINQVITQNTNFWNISVVVDSTIYNWSNNKKNISQSDVDATKNILVVKKNNSSKISNYLPQGINFKESFAQNQNSFSLQSLIILPKHQIILFIDNTDISTKFPPPNFSELISGIYWTIAPTLVN